MSLSSILKLTENVSEFRQLIDSIGVGQSRAVVSDAAKPYVMSSLYRQLRKPLLIVAARADKARGLKDELSAWLGQDAPLYLFPELDALPYERLSSSPYTVAQRLSVLTNFAKTHKSAGYAPLIVTSVQAVMPRIMPYEKYLSCCYEIKRGAKLDIEKALRDWIGLGYEVASVVDTPGTLSRRGGIIDIFPPGSKLPARIELFGDEVESIRLYDPETQRSSHMASSLSIIPANDVLADESQQFDDVDLSMLSADDIEIYRGVLGHDSLIDYLPQNSLVVLDDPQAVEAEYAQLETQALELRESQVQRLQLTQNLPTPYFGWTAFSRALDGRSVVEIAGWGSGKEVSLPFTDAPTYGGKVQALLDELKSTQKLKKQIILVSAQDERLSELLRDDDIAFTSLADGLPAPGGVVLTHGLLGTGWSLGENVVLLTDNEIFGVVKKQRSAGKRVSSSKYADFLSAISSGDYIVHADHGIGRFAGMTTMSAGGNEREFLILEYAEGDKLYVPTDQVHIISRYIGAGGGAPTLTRLGTQQWIKAKQKVQKRAGELAGELMQLYSEREIVSGYSFSADNVWQQELETSFPYIETKDQLDAIRSVKADMERDKPMDRLICGDVGYGKTEVALRAAFKAVMDGVQVGILVPTTILAQQHFTTFTERLGAFPVTIEVLSRFRSDREQRDVLDRLEKGEVDICIGTHRLLQKDITFKNLGLVIIDEEQRFGVDHKERLKTMRKEVDVLTMTATPIPRTLHMALTGVRDMSVMETPPEERLPIKTYVTEYDDELVREAILRELDRGGQVFFVHNRVQTISHIASSLMDLVPEAKVSVGHGQMPERKLEQVMHDFAAGTSDVLVCSTIIESGLDIPNVNTLIINQADKLGLYQLYQLRGRVGRGTNRAYAYFLYRQGKELTDTAQARLKTIFQATELGAGFKIAMRDLEIRGAGNLLGAEQSGHIAAVGFDMYSRMLAQAVNELKAEAGLVEDSQEAIPMPVTIDLPLAAHIPEYYVDDLDVRLALYQRLSRIASPQELEETIKEFKDRFGALPDTVENLFYAVRVKLLVGYAGIESIFTDGNQIILKMREGLALSKDKLTTMGVKVGTGLVWLDMKYLRERWRSVLLKTLEKIGGHN
ncbi:MAG: transcription-repair coupling factor [Chloroflexi bacterium]|nr:transcription-repair coupling factor [Chloroflexota bacterium]MBT7080355.1 transcription-repair coupling factor [Chloroflexota bacterium]